MNQRDHERRENALLSEPEYLSGAVVQGCTEIFGKITTRILPLHGYTRNVHRVHSSAEGCYTWSKPTCIVTYIWASLFPVPAAVQPPHHRIYLACIPGHPSASLSSCRCASVVLFAYYWRAACRQQAIEIPSLSIELPLSLSLYRSRQGEKRTYLVFPLTKISIWHAANRTARRLRRTLFSNSIKWNRGIGTKYARNITGGSNVTAGRLRRGEKSTALLWRCRGKNWQVYLDWNRCLLSLIFHSWYSYVSSRNSDIRHYTVVTDMYSQTSILNYTSCYLINFFILHLITGTDICYSLYFIRRFYMFHLKTLS